MKTLLITGIAGKSGLVLARLLAEGGAKEPWALRLAVRSEEKAEPVKRILPDAEYCRGDLTDAAYVDTLTKGVDVVLHIAGIGKSLLLAKAAAQNGVKRLVLVHTTGIYSKYKAAGEEYRRTDAEITAPLPGAGHWIDHPPPHHDLRHSGRPEYREVYQNGR